MQADEQIWLISFILICVLYVPFRWATSHVSKVSRWHLSLPLFFVAWILMTTLLGIVAPHLGSDWLPLGYAAGLLSMMPAISLIRWAGLFDWYNGYTTMQGVMFLVSSALLNFLLYWIIDYIGSTLWETAMRYRRHLTKS